MANNKAILLIGAGLAAVLYATARAKAVNDAVRAFEYDIKDVRLNVRSILKPEVIFTISIFNPNRQAIPVNSFFGEVRNQNTVIANFNNNSPVTIDGNELATIDVAARISALNVVMQIIQKASFKTLSVAGTIKTALFDMPFQKQLSMPTVSGIGKRPSPFKLFQKKTTAVNPRWFKRKKKQPGRAPKLFQGFFKTKNIPGTLN